MSGSLLTLSCPGCAGLLSVSEGDTNTVCGHCGNHLLLPWGVRKYISGDCVGRTGAVRAVRARIQGISRKLPEGASVRSARLYHVPFWSVTCRVDGYVFGTKGVFTEREVETETEPMGDGGKPIITRRLVRQRVGSEAVEQRVGLDLDLMVSGARLEPLGIPSLGEKTQMALTGMELGRGRLPEGLSIFDAGSPAEGIVVDPVVTLEEAREEASRIVERMSHGAGPDLEQRSLHLAVTGRRERLVYYPLWIVDYKTSAAGFSAVVDGRTGAVLTGRFPEDTRRMRMLLTAAGAASASLVPPLLHLLTWAPPPLRVIAFFFTSLAGASIINLLKLNRKGMTGEKRG